MSHCQLKYSYTKSVLAPEKEEKMQHRHTHTHILDLTIKCLLINTQIGKVNTMTLVLGVLNSLIIKSQTTRQVRGGIIHPVCSRRIR